MSDFAAPAPVAKDAKAGGIETAVLVLDASGGMNNVVGGSSKIAAAKDAVNELVDSWDKTVPLGLTVYGHRNGTCNDIESVIPVGPVDASKFKSAITGLAANGSTPLTEAVIQTAVHLHALQRVPMPWPGILCGVRIGPQDPWVRAAVLMWRNHCPLRPTSV